MDVHADADIAVDTRTGIDGEASARPARSTIDHRDFDACYRAASGRDARWDGRVYLGVTSTGIYCRPSCPARKPRPENCRFFPSAAACVAAGFRACKRCRPEAVPGTRDWDARGDLVARAVRRIRDGAIDAVGVPGLARELSVSERHLRRMLVEEIGAGPLQLARTRRAHAARALIEETDLALADVAFAAGFGSIRQFGDTMREEFGVAPSALPRRAVGPTRTATDPDAPSSDERPRLALRLRTRAPFAAAAMRAFLAAHAIPGRDAIDADGSTSHAIDVPGGTAVARIDWAEMPGFADPDPDPDPWREPDAGQRQDHDPRFARDAGPRAGRMAALSAVRAANAGAVIGIPVTLALPTLADTMPAIRVVRRMLDLDADPLQVADALGEDPVLAPLLERRPGLRLPGARDAAEFALGVVLGQQVSLAAARTLQGRLAAAFETRGGPLAPTGFLASPDVVRVAAMPVEALRETLGLTGARAATLSSLAAAIAGGLDLGPGADRERARSALATMRGIGPWTVELIAMRGLGDPDAYPAGDLILHRAIGARTAREARAAAEPWRPYRGYATQHLWADFLASAT
ncbi:DNA-3-methyladenine glycosylase 2 family protein [Leucobacter zeae]|nr:DNA-3-methyladenine glycosylase 2 family protein [Leucobacter zeae]